jgi:hypothetical protein
LAHHERTAQPTIKLIDGLSYVSSLPTLLMDPLILEALDNHDNRPATGATKAGGGW